MNLASHTGSSYCLDEVHTGETCDIVIAILRHRIGTDLPDDFTRMPNGEPYPSGTAYEILSAIEARKMRDVPDVYVFRYPEPPTVKLDDHETNALIAEQWEKLKSFFGTWFRTHDGHFKAAFHKFHSTDEFESQVETLLRNWLNDKVDHGRSVVWPIDTKGSPFRGLASFGPKHALVFFGRSRDTTKATDAIKDAAARGCPFLLIVGASGSGKSSLARAGLVPRLTTPGVVPSVDTWRVAVMRPRELETGPFAALAARLFEAAADLGDEEEGRPFALPELKDGDYATPASLCDLMRHADSTVAVPILHALDRVAEQERARTGHERAVSAHLLLVIDQLDELFGPGLMENERSAFCRTLSLLSATGRVWVIGTLRADLYEQFLKQPDLLDLKTRGAAYDLAPPSAAEIADIVRGPANAAELVYEVDPQTHEGLDELLLRDADRPDMLPLLQFTLEELFRQRATSGDETRLTHAAYRSLRGMDGAIDQAGERAIAGLGPTEAKTLPKLLRLLVQQGLDVDRGEGTGNLALRSAPLAELEADPAMLRLAQALAACRLLVMAKEGTGGTAKLVHQRIVTSWARADDAVKANADFYRILGDVRANLKRWITSAGHPSALLARGLPLKEGQYLARNFRDELAPDTAAFIDASSMRRALALVNKFAFPFVLCFILISYATLERFGYIDSAMARVIIVSEAFALWPLAAAAMLWGYRRHVSKLLSMTSTASERIRTNLRLRVYEITAACLSFSMAALAPIVVLMLSLATGEIHKPVNNVGTWILATDGIIVGLGCVALLVLRGSAVRTGERPPSRSYASER